MGVMKFITLAVILLAISAFAVARRASAQTPPTVKHVPITNASSNPGKQMFTSYCAVCHGTDARGHRPAASCPEDSAHRPYRVGERSGVRPCRFGHPRAGHACVPWQPGHASRGRLFSGISQGPEAQVQQRTANLVAYIETLQAK